MQSPSVQVNEIPSTSVEQQAEDILKRAVADADLDTFMSGDSGEDTTETPHTDELSSLDEAQEQTTDDGATNAEVNGEHTDTNPSRDDTSASASEQVTADEANEEEFEREGSQALSMVSADEMSQEPEPVSVPSQESSCVEAGNTDGDASQVDADDEDEASQEHSMQRHSDDDDDDDMQLPAGCIRGEPVANSITYHDCHDTATSEDEEPVRPQPAKPPPQRRVKSSEPTSGSVVASGTNVRRSSRVSRGNHQQVALGS